MKLVAALAVLVPSAAALQSPYLSQLSGATPALVNGAGSAVAAPPIASGGFGISGSGPSQELLNLWSDQVSVELAASQLYLSASIWLSSQGLPGMAAWMLEESGEERGHGLAILNFAKKKGFPVTLKTLNAPPTHWSSIVAVWEDILNAEQTNTRNLLRLAAVADSCGEYGCKAFLDPFHIEQIEAEEKVGNILLKVRQASDQFLQQLDFELGQEADEEEHH